MLLLESKLHDGSYLGKKGEGTSSIRFIHGSSQSQNNAPYQINESYKELLHTSSNNTNSLPYSSVWKNHVVSDSEGCSYPYIHLSKIPTVGTVDYIKTTQDSPQDTNHMLVNRCGEFNSLSSSGFYEPFEDYDINEYSLSDKMYPSRNSGIVNISVNASVSGHGSKASVRSI